MTELSHLSATRAAYDIVAVSYAEIVRDELAAKPLDRAMLAAFAELVSGRGPVADLGCGPGRVTAHLHSLGLDAFGIELSPAMVVVAREAYPRLRFDEGTMTQLGLADGAVGGIVAWYSIIHTPPEQLPVIYAEFARVLRSGGYVLVAFQAGDELVHIEQAYGHDVSIDAYRLSPDRVAEGLDAAGLVMQARMVRESVEWEKTPQAYLLARKPA